VTELAPARVRELLTVLKERRILVIGDLMVDRYVWGRVQRVSPEAPVPVVEVEAEAVRLGGAGNVVVNVASLGAVPLVVGIAGAEDGAGRELRALLEERGLTTTGLLEVPGRATTVKTRIIAHHQHVVRADREDRTPLAGEDAERLLERVDRLLPEADAVILQDYNKGVLSGPVLAGLLPRLEERAVPVSVDPKFDRFFDYRRITLFKPNLKEAEAALGIRLEDDAAVAEAARTIRRRLDARHVLITRGERGMTLLESDEVVLHVGTRARRVFDVSGAGDTVIATLTAMLAAGASIREAVELANFAAGVVVGEVGVIPIEPERLVEAVTDYAG
jgi:rfaE bifunctional protein kinase chain/domain